eukprot:TRINITY_DN41538_c0_g1_i1.p1 TRINITY_DN41538_c0_g1~~TRINITY_DN41538_c0_g1_i1.p1  ORF type:complete len:550 (-),score=112.60 TRINITY_DN41538_c0_g1_i1:41-1690(-)
MTGPQCPSCQPQSHRAAADAKRAFSALIPAAPPSGLGHSATMKTSCFRAEDVSPGERKAAAVDCCGEDAAPERSGRPSEACVMAAAANAALLANDLPVQTSSYGGSTATVQKLREDRYAALKVLGTHRNAATAAQLSAFRQAALRAHPDRGGSLDALRGVLRALCTLVVSGGEPDPYHAELLSVATPLRKRLATSTCSSAGNDAAPRRKMRRLEQRCLCHHDRQSLGRGGAAGVPPPASSPELRELRRQMMPQTATQVRVLEELVKVLAAAAPEERRTLLENLSMPVRTALLKHMEKGQLPSRCWRRGKLQESQKVEARNKQCSLGHGQGLLTRKRSSAGRPLHCSLERVLRAGGQAHYRVAVWMPTLSIVTKSQYLKTLEAALDLCPALVQASYAAELAGEQLPQAVLHCQRWTCSGMAVRDAFQLAVAQALADPGKLSLSFCARIYCASLGASVEGRCTDDLAEALKHRSQLLAISGESLEVVSAALAAMRRQPTRRRHYSLTAVEASARVTGALSRASARAAGQKAARRRTQARLRLEPPPPPDSI